MAMLTSAPARGSVDDYVLVTHSSQAPMTLTRAQARRLVSGQTPQWSDGNRVVVIFPPKDSSAMSWLCKSIVRMPETYYRRFVLERAFRGTIPNPAASKDVSDQVTQLVSTPGSVTAVRRSAVTNAMTIISLQAK